MVNTLSTGVAPAQPLLQMERLSIALLQNTGLVPVVEQVSLQLSPGESLAMVGESGCGKTLLARSAMGLLPQSSFAVTAGHILWRGRDFSCLPREQRRAIRGAQMAMAFQEPGAAFNPLMTVGAQIVEAIRSHESLSRRQARARAVRLLAEVGIADPAERLKTYPHQLSGGMRQRAMLALALCCRPSLLIADEPTTALDVSIQAQIVALLKQLRHSAALTLWLITHDLSLVAQLAERVCVMYAGRIVEQADVATVLNRPAHPYTRALLDCLPARGSGETGQRFSTIPGQVPVPGAYPPGCRFHPRCSFAEPVCLLQVPPLSPLPAADGHEVACHFPLAAALASDGCPG